MFFNIIGTRNIKFGLGAEMTTALCIGALVANCVGLEFGADSVGLEKSILSEPVIEI